MWGLEAPFTRKHEILHFPFKSIISMRNSLQHSEIRSQKCKGAIRVWVQYSNAETKALKSIGKLVLVAEGLSTLLACLAEKPLC